MKYLVWFCLILYFVQNLKADHILDQQAQELDPVNQLEYENPEKDQEKRTLFQASVNNYGWAKHTGVRPSGMKYVLGYSPVDLRYVPVIKPVQFKPKLHLKPNKSKWPVRQLVFRPLLPAVQKPTNYWAPASKPVPIHVPPPQNSWQQSWAPEQLQVPVKPPSIFAPSKPSHHVVNLQPAPIFPKPAVVQPAVPVHPVVPVQPVVPVTPLKPVVPVPVTPLRPVLPAQPAVPAHFVPTTPLFPSIPYFHNPLFHVTKPNLPVLPLGAQFPSPVLSPQPNPHAVPNVFNYPIHTPNFAFPQALPSPSLVTFHGKQPQLFNPQIPLQTPAQFLPQDSVHPPVVHNPMLQAALPNPAQFNPGIYNFNLNPQAQFEPQLPRENSNVGIENHDVQTPVIPQHHHQQLLQQHQQQQEEQNYHHQQQQEILAHYQQMGYQNQEEQFEQQQVHSGHQGIQPGQTDLQIPYHLPQHPQFQTESSGFQPGQFQNFETFDAQPPQDNVYRPSITLEPPYTHRREDKVQEDDIDTPRNLNKTIIK